MENLAALYMDAIPRATRDLRKNFRSQRGTELSVPQFRVLMKLRKGPQSNKELAEHIGLSVAAMSRLIQGLEKQKLVQKTSDRKDRRQAHIDLSDKGRNLVTQIRRTVGADLEHKLLKLDSKDQQKLWEGLNVLSQLFPSEKESTS